MSTRASVRIVDKNSKEEKMGISSHKWKPRISWFDDCLSTKEMKCL